MGVIDTAVATAAALMGAVGSRLAYDELKAWSPRLVNRLVRRAVAKLPEGQRERMAEEWASHIDDTPGEVGKLWAAFGFGRAARAMARRPVPWRRLVQLACARDPIEEMTVICCFVIEVAEGKQSIFKNPSTQQVTDAVLENWGWFDTAAMRVCLLSFPFVGRSTFFDNTICRLTIRTLDQLVEARCKR